MRWLLCLVVCASAHAAPTLILPDEPSRPHQALSEQVIELLMERANSCTLPSLACNASYECCQGFCVQGRCTSDEDGRVCYINGVACTDPKECCSGTCRGSICVGQ